INMYKVKPFYSSAPLEDLPGCMYRLPGVHAAPPGVAAAAASQGEDATLLELEQRQEAMLRRLHKLRDEVDDLARAVLVPSGPQSSAPAAGASSSPQLRSCPAHHQHVGQLDTILGMGGGVVHDIVVVASPARPPLSVIVLHELLRHRYRVLTAVHVHSNVTAPVPPALRLCLGPPSANDSRSDHQLVLTIIWKDDSMLRPELRVDVTHACPVLGEGNVARFLWALAGATRSDPVARTQDDAWVDVAMLQLLPAGPKERASVLKVLNAELGR
uniref:Aminoacyl tRNA synthetase complex interacting multifunctional protein 2 n=1 Tax=Petromyzon marinus TaxID=7757 RepID=S4RHW9_PETMA